MAKITISRGDTFTGSVTLRQKDSCDPTKQNVVPITISDTIELNFPGETSTVVLSSANPGEITITDANGSFTYLGDPTKSLLLKLGTSQSLDCIVTLSTGEVTTFELTKILDVKDRANP